MPKRFHIALSFPGEHRSFVLQVAKFLAAEITPDRIFYDEWYEAELLGTGGDLKLQSMYEDADLVVPFFSRFYGKPWCSMEWETIRGVLLTRRKEDAVIPVHLDDTNVVGWSAVNFGIRLHNRTAQEIADILLQALETRIQSAQTKTPRGTSRSTIVPPPSSALAIWKEKLDYLQQQEAVCSDAAQKFALKKQIEEASQKIEELSQNPV